jgi:ATP-dependent RNA helicase RhlE
VVRTLNKAGLAAEAIHGNKSQNQRERVLAAFRAGRLRTLIATDIAARGIDVDGISHVVNYDLPNIPESYVHRIGRTARAGADGVAISFCDAEERAFLRDIEKLIRMSIPATDRRNAGRAPSEHRAHRTNGAAAPTTQSQRQESRKRPHRARSDQKPSRGSNQQQRRTQRPATAPDGGIGTIAFMQPKRGGRRQFGRLAVQQPPR